MTLDLNKPVQTRDGRPVRILCTDARFGPGHRIVGLIDNGGADTWCSWKPSGFAFQDGMERNYDLINVPPKPVKYYVHVYRSPVNGLPTLGALSRDAAYPPQCDLTLLKTIEFEV